QCRKKKSPQTENKGGQHKEKAEMVIAGPDKNAGTRQQKEHHKAGQMQHEDETQTDHMITGRGVSSPTLHKCPSWTAGAEK
ncbi:hypothetical protein HAX54_010462, partial [Datura stramonium]|nr:hypothetical protein [Datura stramonium]